MKCTHMQLFDAVEGVRYVCCLYGKRITVEPETCKGYEEAVRPLNVTAGRNIEDFGVRVEEVMEDEGANPMTMAYAIKALADEYGVTMGRVRRYASAKASYLVYLVTLPKETQKAVSDGKLPYSIANALRRVKDPQTHHEILMQVINGNLSLTKTKQLVSEKMKELKDNGK